MMDILLLSSYSINKWDGLIKSDNNDLNVDISICSDKKTMKLVNIICYILLSVAGAAGLGSSSSGARRNTVSFEKPSRTPWISLRLHKCNPQDRPSHNFSKSISSRICNIQ